MTTPLHACFKNQVLFEPDSRHLSPEVWEAVGDLWVNEELINGEIYNWYSARDGEDNPVLDEFLKAQGVTQCRIYNHW